MDLLDQYVSAIDPDVAVQEAMWAARQLKSSDRTKMMALLMRFMPNEEERLAFLRREDCSDEFAAVWPLASLIIRWLLLSFFCCCFKRS